MTTNLKKQQVKNNNNNLHFFDQKKTTLFPLLTQHSHHLTKRHNKQTKHVPSPGDIKQHLRIHPSPFGSGLHREARPLQHLAALLFALDECPLYLVGVEGMGMGEARERQFSSCSHDSWVAPAGGTVGQRGDLWRGEVALPGLDQEVDGGAADFHGLTWGERVVVNGEFG